MSPAALSASCCSPASRSFASLRSLWPGLAARAVSFGKSDSIDALAVAHAALRYRDKLPVARLAGVERDIALLRRSPRKHDQQADTPAEPPALAAARLDPPEGPGPPSSICTSCSSASMRASPALISHPRFGSAASSVRRCRELTKQAAETEQELAILIRGHAHPLLGLPGVGVLTAAKLIAEVANIERSESDRQLAKLAGVAPLDASSGKQQRHRLNRTGNRQLNRALHTIAITQARIPSARPRLHRPPGRGGQDKERSAASTQTPSRPDHLPAPQPHLSSPASSPA